MRKLLLVVVAAVIVAGALVACGPTGSSSEPEGPVQGMAGDSQPQASGTLNTEHENALSVSNQLALGTLLLESTEEAITPEQAAGLLPLWQTMQTGGLQGEAERNAVLRQIQGHMTSEQVAAIAAMRLTMDDIVSWAEEQGLSLRPPATGNGAGGFAPEGMSQEEIDAMRATRQAGGEGGFAPPEGMSQEEMEAMRATAEASGMRPSGGDQAQSAVLLEPLIELLTRRAGG